MGLEGMLAMEQTQGLADRVAQLEKRVASQANELGLFANRLDVLTRPANIPPTESQKAVDLSEADLTPPIEARIDD